VREKIGYLKEVFIAKIGKMRALEEAERGGCEAKAEASERGQ